MKQHGTGTFWLLEWLPPNQGIGQDFFRVQNGQSELCRDAKLSLTKPSIRGRVIVDSRI